MASGSLRFRFWPGRRAGAVGAPGVHVGTSGSRLAFWTLAFARPFSNKAPTGVPAHACGTPRLRSAPQPLPWNRGFGWPGGPGSVGPRWKGGDLATTVAQVGHTLCSLLTPAGVMSTRWE